MASTGLTALAGCSALGGGSSLSYADWMPDRNEDYAVFTADVTAVLDADVSTDAENRLGESFFAISSDVLDVDDVGAFASAGGEATVCTYTVDREEISEELEEAPDGEVDAPDAPDGYDAFSTREMLYWLGDDYLVAARSDELLEAVYDTNQGETDAYADSDTVSALDDKLGLDDIVVIIPSDSGGISGSTGIAYGWSFEGETANFELVVSFEDEDAAEEADLSTLSESDVFSDYDDLDPTIDGSVAVLTGSVSVSDFDLLNDDSSSQQDRAPQATFRFEYEQGDDGEWNGEGEEYIVVEHGGGATVDIENITVQYAGTDVAENPGIESEKPSADWSAGGTWRLTNGAADGAFASGDDVMVVWTSPSGNSTQILAKVSLP